MKSGWRPDVGHIVEPVAAARQRADGWVDGWACGWVSQIAGALHRNPW